MKIKKCCICGREIYGFGNNPYPVKDEGECCDICNLQRVIPERIMVMQLTNSIHTKVAKELKEANTNEGIKGVNEVLDKYKLEELKIKENN